MSQPKLFDPKNLHKIHVRLPEDDGPNPYDSKTAIKELPVKDWQIAGRGWGWWFSIIGLAGAWTIGLWLNGHLG